MANIGKTIKAFYAWDSLYRGVPVPLHRTPFFIDRKGKLYETN